MYIDRAEWHTAGVPADLDPAAASTHIGIFFAWLLLHGLLSDKHEQDHLEYLYSVHCKTQTGARYIWERCGGDLADEDVHEDVREFMIAYYESDSDEQRGGDDDNGGMVGTYLSDYMRTLVDGLPTMYHVEDTWENYDLIEPVLDAAWSRWREQP